MSVGPGTAEAVVESAGRIVRRLKALNAEIKEIRSEIEQAVGILRSIPGIGPAVLVVILSEVFDSIRKAELQALRCYFGLAPVTKRSGRTILVQRRLADRLLTVVCRMIETGQTFDPERRSKGAT